MKRKGDLLIHESKRRALTDLRYHLPYVSQSALAAILQYAQVHALPAVSGPRELRNVRDAASVGITTPYGPLIQDHRFEHTDGESFTMVEMINPFAMLYYIASTSQFFCDCLEYMLQLHGPCTPETPIEIILYSDEVTPGNQLAHRNARKVQTIYFTFEDFGEFLGFEELWITCSVVACTEVSKIDGGWSFIVGVMVSKFFSASDPGKNMSQGGISLKLHNGKRIHLFVTFGHQLSDELAASIQVYNSKGAQGLKCCKWCANVFNNRFPRPSVLRGPWVITHEEHNISKFVLHTPATIDRVIAELTDGHANLGPDAFKDLQTTLGFSYHPKGVLFDPWLRPMLNPADHSLPDLMHVLYVNGMVNNHLGILFYELRKTTFTYNSAYEFAKLWTWPHSIGGQKHAGVEALSPPRAHTSLEAVSFKASASETRSILPVLAYFARQTLKHSTGMTPEQRDMLTCLIHLYAIVHEFEASSRGMCDPDRLERHLETHMELFVRLAMVNVGIVWVRMDGGMV